MEGKDFIARTAEYNYWYMQRNGKLFPVFFMNERDNSSLKNKVIDIFILL